MKQRKEGLEGREHTDCSCKVQPLGGGQSSFCLMMKWMNQTTLIIKKPHAGATVRGWRRGECDMQKRKPGWYQSWRAASTGLLWCRWPPWRSRWWRQQCSESQKQAVWGRRRLAARLLTLWTKNTKLTHSLCLISLWQSFKLPKIRPYTHRKSKHSWTVWTAS